MARLVFRLLTLLLLLLHLHLGQAWDCPTGENCTAGDLFIWSPTIQLTFINQNTLQIPPIKIIVFIAKLFHLPEAVWSIFTLLSVGVVNFTSIGLSWSLFQNSGPIYCKIYFVYFHTALLLQDFSSLEDLRDMKQALKCSQLPCARSNLFPSLLFLAEVTSQPFTFLPRQI